MKSPYKYDDVYTKAAVAIGLCFSIPVLVISLGIEALSEVVSAGALFLFFYAIGAGLRLATRKLLHTKVNNGVNHRTLEYSSTYYLNGTTSTKLRSNDWEITGTFQFDVQGIKNPVILTPQQVREYISRNPEN